MDYDENILNDFIPTKTVDPGVKIVESKLLNVKIAEPKPYGYQTRFKKKQLTSQDVMPRAKPVNIAEFTDVDLIEADKRRPYASRMFYGPGIEHDF